MASISVRLTVALGAAATVAFAASAQQATPQFRSGVDLVTLDLSAMGPDGTPIRDLRADEIRITVGGRPRTLRMFEFVELAPPRPAPKANARGQGRPPAAAVPAGAGRNVYVVVLHEHIRPGNERVAMEGVRRIVDQLEPRDRVALVTLPFGRVEVELTADHERVQSRLHQIVGRAPYDQPVATGAHTTSEAIDLLEFLKSLVPLDGPKTVLLISEGFQGSGGPFDANQPPKDGELMLVGQPGDIATAPLLLDRPETTTGAPLLNTVVGLQGEIGDLRTAAIAARAQFYVIQPHSLPIDATFKAKGFDTIENYGTQADQTRSLATLALTVGGRFLQLSGRSDGVFDRIVRETSGYYSIAFEADQEDRGGKVRSVEVATTRKGATLRARRTFVDPRLNLPSPARKASVLALLREAPAAGGLPVRVGAMVTRADGGKVKVMAAVESLGSTVKEAGFALMDATNAVVVSWPAEMSGQPGPIVSAQIVPAGRYRLRAAAIDEAGAGGSVDYEFDGTLTTLGPLAASSLMTGVVEGTAFRPRLAFTPGDDLVPYCELYGTAADVDVRLELVPAEGGPPVATGTAAIAETRSADRRLVNGALPLGSVAPGEYVVRAAVWIGGTSAGTLTARVTIVP